jgi:competence protein ComEC
MLSAMLLGVVADRPALSMRAVAIAALLILAFVPDEIVNPGFQMSFAAVIGLIALAEWAASRPRRDEPKIRVLRWLGRSRRYVLGMLATSLVATLATRRSRSITSIARHRIRCLRTCSPSRSSPSSSCRLQPPPL